MLFGFTTSNRLRDAITAIPPQRLRVFLREQRWRQGEPWRDKGHDWITPDGDHFLVPSDPTVPHYVETISSLFEMFLAPGIHFEDVMVMGAFGTCDIVRRRIDEPTTLSGSCTLDEARSEIVGLKELLMWSARRFAFKTQNATKLATSYLDRCRAGQTEIGSYVLKVYVPIEVSGSPADQPVFGREATLAAVENVTYFAEPSYSPDDPYPPAMDWHVAEAILRMKSAAGFWGQNNHLEVTFLQSVATLASPASEPSDRELAIPMTSELFTRAEAVYETLKSGEMLQRRTFTGHITDLHKDVPNAKKQDQRITIRTEIDGKPRNVTMRLLPVDYNRAVIWHHDERVVQVDANIDKRWRVWTASEYFTIDALAPEEARDASLF